MPHLRQFRTSAALCVPALVCKQSATGSPLKSRRANEPVYLRSRYATIILLKPPLLLRNDAGQDRLCRRPRRVVVNQNSSFADKV